MTRPRTRYPIESYDPRLMECLMRAGKGEKITLNFPQRSLARRFQQRLHMLRNQMREEKHPDFKIVAKARTSLKWEKYVQDPEMGRRLSTKDDPATLTIAPADSDFSDVLKSAKIEAPSLERDPLKDL